MAQEPARTLVRGFGRLGDACKTCPAFLDLTPARRWREPLPTAAHTPRLGASGQKRRDSLESLRRRARCRRSGSSAALHLPNREISEPPALRLVARGMWPPRLGARSLRRRAQRAARRPGLFVETRQPPDVLAAARTDLERRYRARPAYRVRYWHSPRAGRRPRGYMAPHAS